jgi:hypothetical protein
VAPVLEGLRVTWDDQSDPAADIRAMLDRFEREGSGMKRPTVWLFPNHRKQLLDEFGLDVTDPLVLAELQRGAVGFDLRVVP